jgi:hypothetical protein
VQRNNAELSKVGVLSLDPLNTFAIQPFTVALLATLFLRVNKYSNAMLAVIPPASNVHGAVGPGESSLTIFFAVLEVAFIPSSVIPSLNTAALDRTEAEFALVELIYICKIVLAMALKLTVHKFSLVIAAICPLEATLTLLLAFVELTDISCATTVVPSFFSDTMLSII